MAQLEINTAHQNAILAATGAEFNAGALHIRTGARAGANNAAGGTLIATVTVPNPAFGSPSAGSISGQTPWNGSVAATGAPGHFRLQNAGGTQICEGDAAEAPGSGESLIISDLVDGDLIEGGTVTISSYVISQPAGDSV